MGSFSDYLEDALLDHVFQAGTADYTSPTIYIGINTVSPGDDGSGIVLGTTEPVIGGATNYTRIATIAADWNLSVNGHVDNANPLSFPQCLVGAWGAYDYFFLIDHASNATNVLAWGQLDATKNIDPGDVMTFAAGAIDVTLD